MLSAWRRLNVRVHPAWLVSDARPREGRSVVRWAIAGLTVAALLLILVPSVVEPPHALRKGDVARRTVYPPRGFLFRDLPAARVRAEAEVPPRWRFDAEAAEANLRLLAEVGVPPEGREALRAYLGREPERGEAFRGIDHVVGPAYVERVLLRYRLPSDRRTAVIEVLRPSVLPDEAATEAARAAWLEAHPPEPQPLDPNLPVVVAGQTVSARQAEILRQIDEARSASSILAVVGLGALLLLLVALASLYVERYMLASYRRARDLAAVAVVAILAVLASVVVRAAAPAIDLPGEFSFTSALAPVAAAPMLVSILFGARFAILVGLLVSVVVGATGAGRFEILAAFALGSVAAAFGVSRARRREVLFGAGAITGLSQALVVVLHAMVRGAPVPPYEDAVSAFLGASILAPILVIGSLLAFERLFGLTTNFRLLELSDLNQPILRRMLLEAPGTYQHSLTVASLAEAAAEAIGANSLLARVGCYYHDIGKLRKPEYFTENQAAGESPHDDLKPSLSAAILKAHVKDGIAMGRELGLPEAVVRFVPEHHGTCLMAFFYHKALEEAGGAEVDRREYQYEGPRPQIQETAIAMLADGAEAACRTLQKPSAAKIDRTVRKVINQRFTEGQLDECDITLKDLHLIAESFTRVLCGMYHARAVDYPEEAEIAEAERKAKRSAGTNGAPKGAAAAGGDG